MQIMKTDGAVVVILSKHEAKHLGHRVNVSSYKSFDSYRKGKKLGDYNRHPFADDFIGGLAKAGINLK